MNWVEKYIDLLKTLTEVEWYKKVDGKWTVKDVVAHLVGWEEECVKRLPVIWKNKQKPWFILSEDGDDEFNQKSIEKLRNHTPGQLLIKWEKWYSAGKVEVEKIGGGNMRANPELFGWWFDESHYLNHFDQLKTILNK